MTYKLSLTTAIFINLNIMLGSGIFINAVPLSYKAGFLGSFAYIIVGILILPLMASIAELTRFHPSGGLYTFGAKELHPFIGFVSSWSYFISKLSSSAIMIHISTIFLQTCIPSLNNLPVLAINTFIVALFVAFNMLNIQVNSIIQKIFLATKIVPLVVTILLGARYFSAHTLSVSAHNITPLLGTLPLVLYAVLGFEAACSISNSIINPRRNGPLAIFISYALVICSAFTYQFFVYGSIGTMLTAHHSYQNVLPLLLSQSTVFSSTTMTSWIIGILHILIALSALGGTYSIFFSNLWNLYTLAQNKHLPFSRALTFMNKHHIPPLPVLIEGIFVISYLIIAQGDHIILQCISALGMLISYTISVFSLIAYYQRIDAPTAQYALPLCSLVSCAILASSVLAYLWHLGFALFIFSFILALGIFFFYITHSRTSSSQQ
ncbi:MAG: APC family permease [Candidatus Babeliales bacterium]